MRIAGLDIETTGLCHDKDHVTEIAWCIKDVGDPKPLAMQSRFVLPPEELWNSADYIKPTIAQLTKITMAHLKSGEPFVDVMLALADDLHHFGVEAIVAHNGEGFDKPFLQAKLAQLKPDLQVPLAWLFENVQWLDTSVDCVYPEDCRYTNLVYVAAYFGFVNPFPHAALFDVMTMLRVLEQFDVAEVFERAKIPWIYVQAKVSYDDRQLAKERRFYWETHGAMSFPKTWVKRIKETDLEKERAAAPFEIVKIA